MSNITRSFFDADGNEIVITFNPYDYIDDPDYPSDIFCGRVKTTVNVRNNPSLKGDFLYLMLPSNDLITFDKVVSADGYQWYKYYGSNEWSASGRLNDPNAWIERVEDCDELSPPSPNAPYGVFNGTWQPQNAKMYNVEFEGKQGVYLDWAKSAGNGHGKALQGVNLRRSIWAGRDTSLPISPKDLREWLNLLTRGAYREDGSLLVAPLYAGVIRVYVSHRSFDMPQTLAAVEEFIKLIAEYKDDNGNQLIRVLWVITDALGAQWPNMAIPESFTTSSTGELLYWSEGYLNPRWWMDGFGIWQSFAVPVLEKIASVHPEVTFGISPFNEPTLIDRDGWRTLSVANDLTEFLHNAIDIIWNTTDGQFPISTGLGNTWQVTANQETQHDRSFKIHNHPRLHFVETHRYLPRRTDSAAFDMTPREFHEQWIIDVDVKVRRELNKVGLVGEWESNNTNRIDGSRYYAWNWARTDTDAALYDQMYKQQLEYATLRWFYSLNSQFFDHYSTFGPIDFASGDWPGISNMFRDMSVFLYSYHV